MQLHGAETRVIDLGRRAVPGLADGQTHLPLSSGARRSDDTEARHSQGEQTTARERPQAGLCWPPMLDVINLTEELRHSRSKRGNRSLPAWLSSGTRQRTKRLEKSASEGDTRIDDRSGGSPLTIEPGSDFPLGITRPYP